jgi:hypothetical protein
VTPHDLSEHVRECHLSAERCRRIADAASDPQTRSDFLDLEGRWLRLAESYQFWERLSRPELFAARSTWSANRT